MLDVEQDQILIIFNIGLFPINEHREVLGKEGSVLVLYQIYGAYLGVDKFVAELGEKELRVLLPHIVEVLAYLGI